jgi:hypothetical protein
MLAHVQLGNVFAALCWQVRATEDEMQNDQIVVLLFSQKVPAILGEVEVVVLCCERKRFNKVLDFMIDNGGMTLNWCVLRVRCVSLVCT